MNGLLSKLKSIKAIIWICTFFTTFVAFNLGLIVSFKVYKGIIQKQYQHISRVLSTQLNTSLVEIMNKGFKQGDLKNFVHKFDGKDMKYPYTLEIFSVKGIGEKGSKFRSKDEDPDVKVAVEEKQEFEKCSGKDIKYVYPIKLTADCMSCHQSSKIGDVYAALSVTHDIGRVYDEINKKFLLFFFILSPAPFLFSWILTRFLSKRFNKHMSRVTDMMEGINSVKDLKYIDNYEFHFGYKELDDIEEQIKKFTAKIRSSAVDKDILEFEIRILEKFLITSEVIRDWKENVKNILIEVNKIMETYTLFSLFRVEQEVYNLEIFWRNKPSKTTMENLEHIIQSRIKRENIFSSDITSVTIEHNVADPSKELRELSENDIELQTKSLILDAPRIGGVVGIGVQAAIVLDGIASLIIEGVLATLMNVVGSVKAISKFTRDIEYYTTRDPLTNIFNQRVFWEMLDYEVGRANRSNGKFSIILIDLDNFKNINDTYGHAFGDIVITECAMIIRNSLRKGDILSRFGGDEFVAILPESGEEQAYTIAIRIKKSMEDTVFESKESNIKAKITISVGMSVYPDHADNGKDLFIFADNLLLKAKEEGKNRVIVPTQGDILEVFKSISEKSLVVSEAVSQKKITPFFQPILDLKNDTIVCHEVLSRIETNSGILSASEFIEIAEKLTVISKLDIILMENCLKQAVESNYNGLLFLNLSPRSLILSEFIPEVLSITKQFGYDRSNIVFEITERDTIKNISILEMFISNLKAEGFKFAIDDFGSGFSSFQYLKRFPIDFVKIEGEFIKNMNNNRKDRAIVKSLLVLSKEFNIQTVAEYVENEETFNELKALGIDYCQGYYIGKPKPELVSEDHFINEVLSKKSR